MRKLDRVAIESIKQCTAGLSGPTLVTECERLAGHYGVSVSQIYAVSKAVRPARKPRTDKGKRKADLLRHPLLAKAAEAVVTRNVRPDLAARYAVANLYPEASTVPHEALAFFEKQSGVSMVTFTRYLGEYGISRGQNRAKVKKAAHVRIEADYPGQVIQFDMSTIKETWIDVETLRTLRLTVLDVSDNHPNTKKVRVKIWKFVAIDDYSRCRALRYYACLHPTSIEINDFLLSVFNQWGVPEKLYTDRDGVIACAHVQRMLHLVTQDCGGFAVHKGKIHQAHAAGNSRATGKVEFSNKLTAEYERLIGLLDYSPNLDELNLFTVAMMEELNWDVSRATGERPITRWQRDRRPMRVPSEKIQWLLKSKEFSDKQAIPITGAVTLNVPGYGEWQLPTSREWPFVDWIGQKVSVVWPLDGEIYYVVGLDGRGYEVSRMRPRVLKYDEFASPAENIGQRTRKALTASAKAGKKARKEAGTTARVPLFNTEPVQRPTPLPKPVHEIEQIPLAMQAPPLEPESPILPFHYENWLDLIGAIELLQREDRIQIPPTADEAAWIQSVFAGREFVEESVLRTAFAARNAQPVRKIRRA